MWSGSQPPVLDQEPDLSPCETHGHGHAAWIQQITIIALKRREIFGTPTWEVAECGADAARGGFQRFDCLLLTRWRPGCPPATPAPAVRPGYSSCSADTRRVQSIAPWQPPGTGRGTHNHIQETINWSLWETGFKGKWGNEKVLFLCCYLDHHFTYEDHGEDVIGHAEEYPLLSHTHICTRESLHRQAEQHILLFKARMSREALALILASNQQEGVT